MEKAIDLLESEMESKGYDYSYYQNEGYYIGMKCQDLKREKESIEKLLADESDPEVIEKLTTQIKHINMGIKNNCHRLLQ